MEPTTDGTKQTAAEVQPGPAVEREVPYYFEEFTLSGGCCPSGRADRTLDRDPIRNGPRPVVEKETPYFNDEFTLSGGCCGE